MSESDAEMDSSLGILSPSDMKTSGIMSMTASQASNQGTFTTLNHQFGYGIMTTVGQNPRAIERGLHWTSSYYSLIFSPKKNWFF